MSATRLEFREVKNEFKDRQGSSQMITTLNNNVSLSVTDGEGASLLGRSGCGKSTLLNMAGSDETNLQNEILKKPTNLTE